MHKFGLFVARRITIGVRYAAIGVVCTAIGVRSSALLPFCPVYSKSGPIAR